MVDGGEVKLAGVGAGAPESESDQEGKQMTRCIPANSLALYCVTIPLPPREYSDSRG